MNILGFDITRTAPWDLGASRAATLGGPAVDFQRGEGVWTEATGVYAGRRPSSGVTVTEEGALCIAAVYKCVRVLSESVASLPLKLYRRDGKRREPAPAHPLYSVLHDRGNDLMTAAKCREVMMVHLCLWGNAFAEIVRDGRGDVVGMMPIHPARVTVRVVEAPGGRLALAYEVDGTQKLSADEVFMVAGLGTGILGKSPIQLHREGLGMAVSAERYGATFWANDARPGMVLKHPGTLGDVAYERLRTAWNRTHQGPENAGKVAILEEGMEATTTGLPPEDAQFIETRVHEAREVYGIYRVPPHKVGDLERATFSNIEHQGIEFVQDALLPYLVRFEQAVSSQLLTPAERKVYYASHVVDGLLRGDIKARYEAYAIGRSWGWLSANDVRRLENENPIDNGDAYLQPLNMVEAGTDPLAAGNEDLDGARGVFLPSPTVRAAIERRALPDRYRTAKALETTLRAALKKVVAREVGEIGRAVDERLAGDEPDVAGFGDWLVAFADEHEAWTEGRMRPVFQAMADAMVEAAGAELDEDVSGEEIDAFVRDYTAAFARRHVGSMRGQLLGLVEEADAGDEAEAVAERLAEWEEDRAAKTARRERQRSSNAMTRAVWAVLGVATLTWRAVGKSCPICDEMDGRTSRIGGAFVSGGDTVADLDVSGRVTHPPIHDGCDCIMMPGTGARIRPTSVERRALWGRILTSVGMEPPARAADRAPEPRSYVQRRNGWIQGRYREEMATRYGERDVVIDELRTGTFEGEPYELAPSTCRKICDSGSA